MYVGIYAKYMYMDKSMHYISNRRPIWSRNSNIINKWKVTMVTKLLKVAKPLQVLKLSRFGEQV